MRKATLLAVLMLGAGSQAAVALDAEDTMTAWAAAAASERSKLVDAIISKAPVPSHVSRSELLECLNRAASVSGHEQLPISELAQACSHPSGPGEQA